MELAAPFTAMHDLCSKCLIPHHKTKRVFPIMRKTIVSPLEIHEHIGAQLQAHRIFPPNVAVEERVSLVTLRSQRMQSRNVEMHRDPPVNRAGGPLGGTLSK